MKQVLKLIPILLILFLIGSGCHKEEPLETDPAKIIIGKWKMIKKGNGNNLDIIDPPLGYLEFLKDSIGQFYDYEIKEFSSRKYWIDTLLHYVIFLPNNKSLQIDYSFEFKAKNTEMYLEHRNFNAWYNTMIYKRIN